MDRSFTLMKIAAVAIIIAVVVAAAIMVTDGGKARFNKATRQLNSAASEFDNPALQAYDGATISGAEVITAIDRHASKDVGITVKTAENKIGKIYKQGYNEEKSLNLKGNLTPFPKSDEINESAAFTGSLIRDNNGSIKEIVFNQTPPEEVSL